MKKSNPDEIEEEIDYGNVILGKSYIHILLPPPSCEERIKTLVRKDIKS